MTGQPEPAAHAAAPGSGCTVESHQVDSTIVVSVTGTLDTLTVPQLQAAITAAAEASPAALVIDLSAVEFLASVAMGLLVSTHAELTPAIRFAVVADGPATSRPLKLVGITEIVDLFATREEALIAVAA
jgi:anti-sigma B factor antagonist